MSRRVLENKCASIDNVLSCKNCGAVATLVCTGCFVARYCSRACQLAQFKTHTVTCKAFVVIFNTLKYTCNGPVELKAKLTSSLENISLATCDKLIAKYGASNCVLSIEKYIEMMESRFFLIISTDRQRWIAKKTEFSNLMELFNVYKRTPGLGVSPEVALALFIREQGSTEKQSPVDEDYAIFRKNGYYGFCHPKDTILVCDKLREFKVDLIIDPIAGNGAVAGGIYHFGKMPIDAYDINSIGILHHVHSGVDLTSEEADKLYWSRVNERVAILISWPDQPGMLATSRAIMDRALKHGAGYIIIVTENPGCAMSEESHSYVDSDDFPWIEVEIPGIEHPHTCGPVGGYNYWRVYTRK